MFTMSLIDFLKHQSFGCMDLNKGTEISQVPLEISVKTGLEKLAEFSFLGELTH